MQRVTEIPPRRMAYPFPVTSLRKSKMGKWRVKKMRNMLDKKMVEHNASKVGRITYVKNQNMSPRVPPAPRILAYPLPVATPHLLSGHHWSPSNEVRNYIKCLINHWLHVNPFSLWTLMKSKECLSKYHQPQG